MNGIAYTNRKKETLPYHKLRCIQNLYIWQQQKNEKKAVLNYFIVLNGYDIVDRERATKMKRRNHSKGTQKTLEIAL